MKPTSAANRHATHTDRMFDSHQDRLPNAVLTYFVILRLQGLTEAAFDESRKPGDFEKVR